MAPGCFLTGSPVFDNASVAAAGLAGPAPSGRRHAPCATAVGAPLPATLPSSAPGARQGRASGERNPSALCVGQQNPAAAGRLRPDDRPHLPPNPRPPPPS